MGNNTYTLSQLKKIDKIVVKDNVQNNRLQDDTSGTPANDYANGTALHGAANRFLKQPFNGSIAFGFR